MNGIIIMINRKILRTKEHCTKKNYRVTSLKLGMIINKNFDNGFFRGKYIQYCTILPLKQ